MMILTRFYSKLKSPIKKIDGNWGWLCQFKLKTVDSLKCDCQCALRIEVQK